MINDIKVGDTVEVSDIYYRLCVPGRPQITTVTGIERDTISGDLVWLANFVGWVPAKHLTVIGKLYTVEDWTID